MSVETFTLAATFPQIKGQPRPATNKMKGMSGAVQKRKKFVVLGSAGQLGRDLCPRLPGEVVALTRADFDLTQPEPPREMLAKLAPDLVINCAAYNYVDRAESEPAAAFAVNAWAVKRLAVLCRELGCTLVHFSTDYVFGLDTGRREPYGEADPPGPLSVYGLSKLSGEFMVRTHCPRHFVIRTCGLYGASGSGGKGGNFVETMLRLAREGKPLRVVADQVCAPSYTVHVAEAVVKLVQTEHFGMYHLTNSGSCSWHQFAQKIFAVAGINANLATIGSAEYGSAARRPGFSVLANARYEALGFPKLPVWQDAVEIYLRNRDKPP